MRPGTAAAWLVRGPEARVVAAVTSQLRPAPRRCRVVRDELLHVHALDACHGEPHRAGLSVRRGVVYSGGGCSVLRGAFPAKPRARAGFLPRALRRPFHPPDASRRCTGALGAPSTRSLRRLIPVTGLSRPQEQKAAASHTAFSTAGIYAAFLALSLLGIGFNKFYGRL